jgi:putative ABC transport system permease protein
VSDPLLKTLRRLVPKRQRCVFDPSYHDLVAEHLSAGEPRGIAFRLRAAMLVVQCHTLWLREWVTHGLNRRPFNRTVTTPRQPPTPQRTFSTHSLLQDLRYALRTLAKVPAYTAFVVLILAVGIGANVAMFGVTNAALLRPLPFPDADRLVMGRATFGGRINPWVSVPDYRDYRDQTDALESLAAIFGFTTGHTVTGGAEPERVYGTIASVHLFRTLGIAPQIGRDFTADDADPSAPDAVMISHGYWQRRFGGSYEAVGATLIIDGVPHTVVGVMPAGFHFLFDVDLWRPLRTEDSRNNHSWLTVGRLRPGISLEHAQTEMDVISARLREAYPATHDTKAFLLTDLQDALAAEVRPSLLLLVGAIGLVLLIACGNVASLLLARGSTRSTELSIRAALGASRGRLARQLFTENLVMAVGAGALGTVLAAWLQRLILAFVPLDSLGIREVQISTPVLGFALTLSLGTALLFGAFPALSAARANPAEHLESGTRTSAHGSATRVRSGLVILQITLSVVLLTGSGILIRSFARLRGVDMGFDTERLLVADIKFPNAAYPDQASRQQFFAGLLDDVRAIAGVRAAAVINKLPIRSPWSNWSVWDPENPPQNRNERRSAFSRTVQPGYFATMGIPILSGRDVERTDGFGARPKFVINEAMARRLFPDQDPIGRAVAVNIWLNESQRFETRVMEVVGVVGDIRVNSMAAAPGSQMYFPYAQLPHASMSLAVRTAGEPMSVVGAVRAALRARDPKIPLANLDTMEEIVSHSVSDRRTLNVTLTLFATVAVALAVIGLYGVLAYHVTRRIREIGIRVALGATEGKVMQLVLRRGLVLVSTGLVLGIGVAAGTTRILQPQLYGVSPTDPATFVVVSVSFAAVGVLACLLPAMRATRVDPLVALQAE